MSEATIVSVYPFNIVENKPHHPGVFKIPGAKDGDISILEISDCWFPVYLDGDRGSFRVTVPAVVVANSIINDRIRATEYINLDADTAPLASPGLGFLPEKLTKVEILSKHKEFVADLRNKQTEWFKNCVRIADDLWARFHRHSMIDDVQRYASRYLKMDREWAMEAKPESVMECKACTNVISSRAIVCPHCRVILNETEYKKMQFALA